MKLSWVMLVGAGGFIGAIARYFFTLLFSHPSAVLGTLTVNVIGSLFAGILFLLLDQHSMIRAFLVIGFLGSFTTFSAFSVDSLSLFERQEYLNLLTYIFLNISLSIVAVFIGYYLFGRALKAVL